MSAFDPHAVFAAKEWDPTLRVGVAVSGGPDSVGALRIIAERAGRTGRFVVALHVDHRLRPDSGRDAEAARAAAERAGVPFDLRIAEVATGTGSFEGPARDARYAALAAMAGVHGLDRIVVAHSHEDQLETVLLALRRGGGLGGLGGLREFRPLCPGTDVWRPFLDVPRERLRAAAGDFASVADPTNEDRTYRRNAARLTLLPALRRIRPDIDAVVTEIGLVAQAIEDRAREAARAILRAPSTIQESGLLRVERTLLLAAARSSRARLWLDAWNAEPAFGGPPSTGAIACLEESLTRTEAHREPRRGVAFDVAPDAVTLWTEAVFPVVQAAAPPEHGPPAVLACGELRRLVVERIPGDPDAAFPALDDGRVMRLYERPESTFSVEQPTSATTFRLETGAGRGRLRDVIREAGVAMAWRRRIPVVRVNGDVRWVPGLRRVGRPRGEGEVGFEIRLEGPAPWFDRR